MRRLTYCWKWSLALRVSGREISYHCSCGFVGGEEDGVDNTGVDNEDLYSKPEEVWEVYKAMSAVGPMFTIAAAFGNVHGVYKPGNVVLTPGRY